MDAMKHDEMYKKWPSTSKVIVCKKLADGRFTRGETSVIIERDLPIYVNGRHLVTASIMPVMEKEFIIGYLFGQGFINSVEEVTSLEMKDHVARVKMKDTGRTVTIARKASYRIVSGGGRMAFAGEADLPPLHDHRKIRQRIIFKAINTLFETARTYRETEGVHAAGLFNLKGGLICIVEDIGRHNTLDKVIGYALFNEVDCADAFLVSTGRMTSEMVAKICRAGIPVVATKTAVTDRGLEIGRKRGLTIIGFLRDAGTRLQTNMETRVIDQAGMKIYTGASRVLCGEEPL
jgi:FdhD protein